MTSIAGMAGMLHPPSATTRVIVALRAYFDESGTHWGGPLACDSFVLCGYLAPELFWDDKTENSFTSRWNNVMHGKPFHATEMDGNPQADTVKPMLADVVIKSGIVGVGGGVHIPTFKRLLDEYIPKNDTLRDPYLFLFTDVILEAIGRSQMFIDEDEDEPIGFVFANHERWSLIAHDLYLKMQNQLEWENRRRLGVPAFDDIDRFIPLQAADHIAFETYHYMNDPPGTPERRTMSKFLSWPQHHGRYWKEKPLRQLFEECKKDGKL